MNAIAAVKKWRSMIWIWSKSSITKMTSSITSLLYYAVVQCALVFRRKWLADDTHIANEDCSNLLWLINTLLQLLLERAAISINTAISHTKPISLHHRHHQPPTVHPINTAQPFDTHCCHTGNYKWQLNLVCHRMLYSCTHMATMGVKGLMFFLHATTYRILL